LVGNVTVPDMAFIDWSVLDAYIEIEKVSPTEYDPDAGEKYSVAALEE
jgi:hypothetical protein